MSFYSYGLPLQSTQDLFSRTMYSEFFPLPIFLKLSNQNLDDIKNFASRLAILCKAGDIIALWGDLGAGKTTFARYFIQALYPKIGEIPSPTFPLVQVYCGDGETIWHFDLYRLQHPEEALELSIEEAWASAVSLIEWPQRLKHFLPKERLDIVIEFAENPEMRHINLYGSANWQKKLVRAGLFHV